MLMFRCVFGSMIPHNRSQKWRSGTASFVKQGNKIIKSGRSSNGGCFFTKVNKRLAAGKKFWLTPKLYYFTDRLYWRVDQTEMPMKKLPFSEDTLLFVYGTLRSDCAGVFQQHFLHRQAQLLGGGWIQANLFDVGEFPAAIASMDARERVFGEVYALPKTRYRQMFSALDAYEDCNSSTPLYIRKKTAVAMRFYQLTAWVYWYNQPPEGLTPIPHGDYRLYFHPRVDR